jgi:hypothetical protein
MSAVAWWASVMVVSLVLTAASAYLMPWIERSLGPLTEKGAAQFNGPRPRGDDQHYVIEVCAVV